MRKQQLIERARTMREPVDPTPLEVPTNKRPPTLREQLQAYIRQQVSLTAQESGYDSFEDEDDFEDDENEGEWFSPYELSDMQPDQEAGAPLETLEGTDDTPAPEPDPSPPPIEQPSGSA